MKSLLAIWLALPLGATLRAEFSYQETAQITRGPVHTVTSSTYLIKGNRMVASTKNHFKVIDLDRETVTEIDLAKKTFGVVTFAQIKQQRGAGVADKFIEEKFKASATATGRKKLAGVLTANELVVTLTKEDADMEIVADAWMATVPGYDEVKDFQRKLRQKLGSPYVALPGWEAVYQELNKVEGVPIEFTMKKIGAPSGSPDAAAIRLTDFSAGPVDGSRFEVPAGFKKTEQDH